MDKKIAVLKYQDNFADNFSTYAYGKLIENKFCHNCVYENTTDKRKLFEEKMENFNLSYSYISNAQMDSVSKTSKILHSKDIKSRSIKKNQIINMPLFRIDDMNYLTDNIKENLNFKNLDFIKNYDILEEITSINSIGIYINSNDEINDDYIKKASKRLNKYLKKPMMYFFTSHKFKINSDIEYKILNLHDWREEFYFLKSCRNTIIHCTKHSYSEGFWASVLANYKYGYHIYSKELKATTNNFNWIKI